MRKPVSVLLLFTMCQMLFLAAAPAVQGQELIKIAVMDIKAKQGVSPQVTSSLTDLICTQIADIGTHEVIGRDDMQAMLEHIADKQLLECDDTKCLAQVGGALGVEQLLSGNIGMIGQTYLINMKLIDIDNAKVLKRVSREYAGSEGGLISEVKQCISVVFGLEAAAAPAAAAPAPAAAPAMMPAQIRTEDSAVKSAPEKGGFPWLWVGLGTLVAGGAVAAVVLLGGDDGEEEDDDLDLPPDLPAVKAMGGVR